MSTTERAAVAGRARANSQTPAERKELARRAHLASAVSTVVNRAPDLTPEQFSKLRAVFSAARSI